MTKTAFQKSLGRTNQGDGFDYWETPDIATKALLDRETFEGSILEPACGKGAMIKSMIDWGIPARRIGGFDIIDRKSEYQSGVTDFLSNAFDDTAWHNIITNPPYGKPDRHMAQKFVEMALTIATGKVAMLLKQEFVQADCRYDLMTKTPLKTIYYFSYRVPFIQPGYERPITNQRHAWFVWEQGHPHNNVSVKWIRRDKK